MYLDLAANSSYGRYNKKLVKLIGLEGACYWDYIVGIAFRAKEKATIDDEGYFTINRAQIETDLLLPKEQQFVQEAMLTKLGWFQNKSGSGNRGRCDFAKYSYMMIEDQFPENVIKEISDIRENQLKFIAELKLSTVDKKRSNLIQVLKDHVCKVESDQDLKIAYCNLIDVIYDKGICKNCQVDLFITGINSYTSDKNIKLEILKIATVQSLRDPSWAISQYEKTKRERGATLFAAPQIEQQTNFKNKIAF